MEDNLDTSKFEESEIQKYSISDAVTAPNSDKPKPKRESRTRYGLPEARETG
jgi:hypothetical protein